MYWYLQVQIRSSVFVKIFALHHFSLFVRPSTFLRIRPARPLLKMIIVVFTRSPGKYIVRTSLTDNWDIARVSGCDTGPLGNNSLSGRFQAGKETKRTEKTGEIYWICIDMACCGAEDGKCDSCVWLWFVISKCLLWIAFHDSYRLSNRQYTWIFHCTVKFVR